MRIVRDILKFHPNHLVLTRIEFDLRIDVAIHGLPGNLLRVRANSLYRRRLTFAPSYYEMLWPIRAVLDTQFFSVHLHFNGPRRNFSLTATTPKCVTQATPGRRTLQSI